MEVSFALYYWLAMRENPKTIIGHNLNENRVKPVHIMSYVSHPTRCLFQLHPNLNCSPGSRLFLNAYAG